MQSSKIYLYKRSSRFYIQFVDHNGKERQVSTGCTTKTKALEYLKNHENKYTIEHSSKKLSHFIEEFSLYGKSIYTKSTFRSYCSALKNLHMIVGESRLSSLSMRTADQFKSRRLQTVSPASVNVDLRALKSMFKLAKRWGYIGENPFADIPLARTQQREPKFLSNDNYHALIEGIKEPWLKSVVQFAIFTGMRISEITNLRWEQIYFERKIILVANSSHFQTKNKRNRIVPISEPVLKVLQDMSEQRAGEYVFHNTGHKLCGSYTSKKFKRYVRSYGFDDKFVFHNLRSTFASWMIMNGVDLFIVSKLLGHSDISVTSKYYANVHNEYLFNSVSTFNFEKLAKNQLSLR